VPKKSLFQLEATAKASQFTMSSHYPVTWNKQDHLITATGLSHCPGSSGAANPVGYLSVRNNPTQGNFSQG
jgi:hypothetical protein